jgi:hypothetical protein
MGVLRLQEDDGKLHRDVLVLLLASIPVSSGGRQCAMATTREKATTQFRSKIYTI